jgi:hypothetical protein
MAKKLKKLIEEESNNDTFENPLPKAKFVPRHSVSCEVYKNITNYQLTTVSKSEKDVAQYNTH